MVLGSGGLLSGGARTGWGQDAGPDLTQIDVERLLQIEVTSAAKHEEPLFHTASAIYVITQADIERSGATNIPDLLRLVPGLEVAQTFSSGWAISSRGFAELYSSKLLVLVDGRTVYDPLFSGVYWDAQNLMLEDIERIEVIRGPGATLWGANAVNGVINILTRSARDTQGGLLSTTVATTEPVHANARYGGKLGSSGAYRVYGSYFRRDHSRDSSGNPRQDRWAATSGGFRTDWSRSGANSFTLQGDVVGRGADETLLLPSLSPPYQFLSTARTQHRGGNLLARWNHHLSSGNDWTLQTYYDRATRQGQALAETLQTFDLDFEHHFKIGRRQDWIWGAGYRVTGEDFGETFLITVRADTEHQFNSFWQDEITLIPNRLQVIPGTKLEQDRHSGWNAQPSVRLLWTPGSRHTVWAAVSRALRTPSDLEVESRINSQVFAGPSGQVDLVSIFGNEGFQSEKLLAYELGYRVTPARRFSLDLATFYNVYHDLETTEPAAPFYESSPVPPHLVIAQQFENLMHGETYGAELAANWNVTDQWRLAVAYSHLQIRLHLDPRSRSTTAEAAENNSPHHEVQIRSHLALPRNVGMDLALQHVSALSGLAVPAYTRLDTRLSWQPAEFTTLSVGAQNLLSPRHLEFGDFRQLGQVGQAERNVYGKLTWRF